MPEVCTWCTARAYLSKGVAERCRFDGWLGPVSVNSLGTSGVSSGLREVVDVFSEPDSEGTTSEFADFAG